MRLAFTPYYKVTTNAKKKVKVPARKNASHPLKIHTKPSSDDSDFVHPPPKRNKALNTNLVTSPGNHLDPRRHSLSEKHQGRKQIR
jgi:hypothetical protein